MRAIFLYNPAVVQYDYGETHPFRLERIWLTEYLCRRLGLFEGADREVRSFEPATREDLLVAHDSVYLDVLEAVSQGIHTPALFVHGLGSGDNPVFPGLWDYALNTAGGTLEAARLIAAQETRRVFHPGGGLHHALRRRASGFCYVNDVVVAIDYLLARGKRVFYFDLDAHHGDGVEQAFYENPRVFTLSIHQDGRTLFPGSGFLNEIGRGEGAGYAANVPLLPCMADETYLQVWAHVAAPLIQAFEPDVLLTELGADALQGDPLASMGLHLRGWWEILGRIASLELPWLAVGGGGYDLANAMRAWTLAWGAMVGWQPGERLPLPDRELPGIAKGMVWPADLWSAPVPSAGIPVDGEATAMIIRQLRQQLFPHHGLEP
ncbi:MAG: acetoin utilization protein AcuC [Candidatus Eisenbacteria bacterium]